MRFNKNDNQVFFQYSLTMLDVQRFEAALKKHVNLHLKKPGDVTYEQAWQDVRKILRSAVGPLTRYRNECSGTKQRDRGGAEKVRKWARPNPQKIWPCPAIMVLLGGSNLP